MIEPEDYRLPQQKEPKKVPTEEENRRAAEVLAELERLPWRPHGDVW